VLCSNEIGHRLTCRKDSEGDDLRKLNITGGSSNRSLCRSNVLEMDRSASCEGHLINSLISNRIKWLSHSLDHLVTVQASRHGEAESVAKVDQGLPRDRRLRQSQLCWKIESGFWELISSISSRNLDDLRLRGRRP